MLHVVTTGAYYPPVVTTWKILTTGASYLTAGLLCNGANRPIILILTFLIINTKYINLTIGNIIINHLDAHHQLYVYESINKEEKYCSVMLQFHIITQSEYFT